MLNLHSFDGYLAFKEDESRKAGRALADDYRNASPFPHVVIDDFLDADVLRAVASAYPSTVDRKHFDREQERLKYQFHADEAESGIVRNLLAELNGRAFLGFLEEMTGIRGLISDPYLVGGGLHLTRRGGHLGVHADFNVHEPMKVERRLNLLIYLNDDWDQAYGGALELWDRAMQRCEKKVDPVLGRAVIFSTNLDSYHGHPDPLDCPPERDRRSIATYYYTALPVQPDEVRKRTTTFQVRPGTKDRVDWKVKFDHVISDWVPPRLQRYGRRLNPFR
ncbi:2OG-Fe(II) oxygenase [Sphingomonas lutea]|uniref:2OG-Fe(II) oxygenase n=1 Tax=Sphingomonas lutea TaxID=1045317 RepID=A0A7G9SH11_9SPHN|nr:2OG-Fe(II) oxygenase [Sphingomonas lutea]QNN67136.1 2OG-Fe(II) oxygenase [Sphingomonas lutea]